MKIQLSLSEVEYAIKKYCSVGLVLRSFAGQGDKFGVTVEDICALYADYGTVKKIALKALEKLLRQINFEFYVEKIVEGDIFIRSCKAVKLGVSFGNLLDVLPAGLLDRLDDEHVVIHLRSIGEVEIILEEVDVLSIAFENQMAIVEGEIR